MGEPTRRETIVAAAASGVVGVGDSHRDLMLGFCSLGDNCEFGFAQRKLNAEPLDLLVWANTPTVILLKLLRGRFAGIGNADHLEVFTGPTGEYFVKHTGYHFAWHAFEKAGPDGTPTPGQIRDKAVKRMTFLANKMADDLKEAKKIFVVKDKLQMTQETAREILTAIHAYGDATLMYATQGPGINVVQEADRLLHATLPKFADPAWVPETLENDWLVACKSARVLLPV